jgi:hypothetical protein
MLASKKVTLKPILESKDGIHLTVYLVNRGDSFDLKSQLRSTMSEASDWLDTAMTSEERNKFLEPLESLFNEDRIFSQMKGNIGIFRNEDSFRILNIPIDVEQSCQVATSFHVKPLLRWLQSDQEFLLLGLDNKSAHLYLGSQNSFKLVDSILFPNFFQIRKSLSHCTSLKLNRQISLKEAETFSWVNDWILDRTKNSKLKLFVAGAPSLVKALHRKLSYNNAVKTPISKSFANHSATECAQNIRNILKADSKMLLQKALLEFRFAEENNRLQKNIFQIAKAVVQGKVRKLIVTDEVNIFGKIDHQSGGIAIHPFDLDHEDDCILDDLAQIVLSQGGEVVIARRDEIPKGRPILAILDDDDLVLEKTERHKYEAAACNK